MIDYDPGTNTFTWDAGSEEQITARKVNVGTVTSPTVGFYKLNNESDLSGNTTYLSAASGTVTNDGTTVIFTTPKFQSTIPSGTYKLILKGTVNSLATYIHVAKVVVRKKSVI
jgi:hypothetical protein